MFLSAPIMAHQDRILDLSEKGEITGLPDEYLPAKIELNNKVISIGEVTFTMPPCVSKYFENLESYNLRVTSSWYHQRSILPPYINFNVIPKNKDFSYSLLFGLEDLKVIEFQVITHPSKDVTAYHKVAITEHCIKSIGNSYQ